MLSKRIRGRRTALILNLLLCSAASLAATATPALAGGSVMRWGSFGLGTAAPVPTPVAGLSGVKAVLASNASSYALEANGTVWAWGNNRLGELGEEIPGSPFAAVEVPLPLPSGVTATAIGQAEFVGVAIDSTGHAWAWGLSGPSACMGQFRGYNMAPTEIPGISEAVQVVGGEHHTVWLLANGTVETCGDNNAGQLGVAGISSSGSPVHVPGLTEVVEVSSAERTSCALTRSGAVYVWGANSDGQVGNGEESASVSTPYHVPLPGPASQVSCGGNIPTDDFTLALVGGQVYGWGADQAGQLGENGNEAKELHPVATGLHFAQIAAGGATSFGLSATGQLYAWGSNFESSLGTGGTRSSTTPRLIDEGVEQVWATAHNAVDLH